jgi:uncharacterized protein (DUF2236 family)
MSITDVENHRSGTSAELPIDGSVRPKVMSDFRKHVGSVLAGAFGAAAFDEVAMIPVAAAVDHTGRFAENFTNRGLRSGLSAMLAYWGDSDDRAAEAEWLKHQHRDVRGHGQGGPTPGSWTRWVITQRLAA